MIRGSFRASVPFEFVFPHGCLCLDVSAVVDFDKPRTDNDRQARDKETGERLWQATVLDLDPDAARFGRQQVKVKLAAPVQPVPPAPTVPGYPPAVEFTSVVLTPWVDDGKCTGHGERCRARMAFSIRADAMIAGQIAAPLMATADA